MTDQEFAEILAFGYERRGTEFKGPGPLSAKPWFAKVVRAVLGMANQRDGGLVVIGVDEEITGVIKPVGLSEEDLATWKYDDVAAAVATYADPFISFDLEVREYEGKRFVLLHVREFDEIPVLCRKEYPDILRSGGCYVRTRRKPETSEVPSQTEMRELLDLAVEKGLRKFISQALAAGLITAAVPAPVPTDSSRYEKQLGDFST